MPSPLSETTYATLYATSMSHSPYPFQAGVLRWLYIDFNSYFASVEQELNPTLRGKPVAVVPVDTDTTCAIAASYEAKAFGIKTGTPIYEAKKLCPELICVVGQHEQYVAYHHRIIAEVEQHIPVTAVCSIDEVACWLMDNETSVERAAQIALSIKKGLASHVGRHITCSIGIAPNRYLAKVATDLKKPDGLTFIQAQDISRILCTLNLGDLPGIGRNIEKRLRMRGIGDVKSLLELSPDRMRTLWGSVWGEKMWYLLRGKDLQEEETQRSSVGHSHVMAPELRDPARAKYVMRRLTLKAVSRLRRMGYYASHLSLAARTENGLRQEAHLSCYRAQDSVTFLRLMEEGWQTLLQQTKTARLRKLSVVLHGLTAANELQPELFTPVNLAEREKAERVSHALDKINQRFGRDSILLGMLPSQGRSFSGTRIAFTRIPNQEEFKE